MRRRSFIKLAGAAAVALPFPKPAIAQAVTLRWWYHFDNPQNSPAAFVAKFEKDNPGIKIQAEAIPWGGGTDYANRIFASAVAGTLPDTGLVRLSYLSQLMRWTRSRRSTTISRLGPRAPTFPTISGSSTPRKTARSTICRRTMSFSISATALTCSSRPACSLPRRSRNSAPAPRP